jgi:photosystem II stability/assembly factor-like uncharacterized protein
MFCRYPTSAALVLASVSLFTASITGQDHPERIGSQRIWDDFSYSISPHEGVDLFFLDTTHAWMAVTDHGNHDSGYILRTQNGGITWRRFKSPDGLKKLFFINRERGWALRWSPDDSSDRTRIDILTSADGGENWMQISTEPSVLSSKEEPQHLTSMTFMDEEYGWIVGEGRGGAGIILETSDGGRTFKKPYSLSQAIPSCLGVYARRDVGALVFGIGYVLRSADKGKTWQSPVDLQLLGIKEAAFNVSSAAFLNDGRGWLVGQGSKGGIILRTQDLGQSWQTEFESRSGANFSSIWLLDGKRRCVVGYRTRMFCTTDDGHNWSSKDVLPAPSVGQADFFKNIVILESGRGWVIREGGYLYQTDDSGVTWHDLDPMNP